MTCIFNIFTFFDIFRYFSIFFHFLMKVGEFEQQISGTLWLYTFGSNILLALSRHLQRLTCRFEFVRWVLIDISSFVFSSEKVRLLSAQKAVFAYTGNDGKIDIKTDKFITEGLWSMHYKVINTFWLKFEVLFLFRNYYIRKPWRKLSIINQLNTPINFPQTLLACPPLTWSIKNHHKSFWSQKTLHFLQFTLTYSYLLSKCEISSVT